MTEDYPAAAAAAVHTQSQPRVEEDTARPALAGGRSCSQTQDHDGRAAGRAWEGAVRMGLALGKGLGGPHEMGTQ